SLQGLGGPVRLPPQARRNLPEKRLRIVIEQGLRLLVHRQRARLEEERRAVGQFDEVARAGLESGHGAGEERLVRGGADPFGGETRQPRIVRGADVVAVEAEELLGVEPARALADAFEAESLGRLLAGELFLVTVAPAEPQ